jgi:hypothetical protein
MTLTCRLYGLNLQELAETIGSADAVALAELEERHASTLEEFERGLEPGTVRAALRRWFHEPIVQVGETVVGMSLALAFEILCLDASQKAGAPKGLRGDRPVPPISTMADDIEALDLEFDFDTLESRMTSRKTCGVVFQTREVLVGHLSYLELRRLRAAFKGLGRDELAELPFFAALMPLVKLAVRHELDVVTISR